jgi:hypothetical protein
MYEAPDDGTVGSTVGGMEIPIGAVCILDPRESIFMLQSLIIPVE